jgi:hypothetical protein
VRSMVRSRCVNGRVVDARVLTLVTAGPLVTCLPNCSAVRSVRMSYTSASGLVSLVGYRIEYRR